MPAAESERAAVRHPLLGLMLDATRGRFPPVDGRVCVVAEPGAGLACSYAFTGHAVVATSRSRAQVLARSPDGYGGSFAPDFLRWLAGPGGSIGVLDVTLWAQGRGGGALPQLTHRDDHPRVRHARTLRSDVVVYGDERGVVTLGTGLAGRQEISCEAVATGQGRGWGRSLLVDGLRLVPAGEPVFAAVAPGNARSLRAVLGTGFVPIGAEVIVIPAPGSDHHADRPARFGPAVPDTGESSTRPASPA